MTIVVALIHSAYQPIRAWIFPETLKYCRIVAALMYTVLGIRAPPLHISFRHDTPTIVISPTVIAVVCAFLVANGNKPAGRSIDQHAGCIVLYYCTCAIPNHYTPPTFILFGWTHSYKHHPSICCLRSLLRMSFLCCYYFDRVVHPFLICFSSKKNEINISIPNSCSYWAVTARI